MKKIILFLTIIFIITSCGKEESKVVDKKVIKDNITIDNKVVDDNQIEELENLLNNQEFDKALPILEKDYNENSKDIGSILNYMSGLVTKGSITRQEKEYADKALVIGNKALLKFSDNSELYRTIGYAYEIKEEYKKAFENYDKAIELDPKNALAYSNRGHAYRLYGDYLNAEKDFKKAYELDKTNDFILINLAWLYNNLYELDKAIEYYVKVTELTKNIRFKSEAYHSIGLIYIGKGEIEKAKESFKNAIKADEKFELGYLGLSDAQMIELINSGEEKTEEEKKTLLNEALKNNSVAIALNPTRAMSYFKKGLILNDIEEYKKDAGLMFQLALDTLEVDITLGKKEKESLKKYINNLNKYETK